MLQEYIQRVQELNPTIIIRKAEPKDASQFVALFNKHYKRKIDEAYFQWQFFESSIPSVSFLALDGEALVATYGIKVHPLSTGEKTCFVIDFLIDDAYRKRGLAFLLEGAAQDFAADNNISVFTALPNQFGNSALKALGWTSIAKVDQIVNNGHSSDVQAEEKALSTPSYCFLKDRKYREWRMNKHPKYHYETIGSDIGGFVTIKKFEDPSSGATYGDIVDIQSGKDADGPLQKALEMCKEWGVSAITTWALPHTPLFFKLRELGFNPVPQERYFCVKSSSTKHEYSTIEKWELVQMDAEIF